MFKKSRVREEATAALQGLSVSAMSEAMDEVKPLIDDGTYPPPTKIDLPIIDPRALQRISRELTAQCDAHGVEDTVVWWPWGQALKTLQSSESPNATYDGTARFEILRRYWTRFVTEFIANARPALAATARDLSATALSVTHEDLDSAFPQRKG